MTLVAVLYNGSDGEALARQLEAALIAEYGGMIEVVLTQGGGMDFIMLADAADYAQIVETPGALAIPAFVTALTQLSSMPRSFVRSSADIAAAVADIRARLFTGGRPPKPGADREREAEEEDVFRGIPDDLLDNGKSEAPSPPPAPPASIPPSPPQRRPSESAPPPATTPEPTQDEPIEFSSYALKEVTPQTWVPMRAYVYKVSAARQVAADASAEFRDFDIRDIRTVTEGVSQAIREGSLITATPELEGFQFNPPSVSQYFFEDWHRFDFKMRAHTASVNQSVNGVITFTVEGVIIADLPLSVFVAQASSSAALTPKPSSTPAPMTAQPYQAIFCSYSHRDTTIVERVERVYKALGMTYLRDAVTLRSGENWNNRLLEMINEADIFQLFWSISASKSKYVQQEWEYALERMKNEKIPSFIRPVYWEDPMPSPPEALGHLHFHRDETLDDGLTPAP